jgi:hypothetical protein
MPRGARTQWRGAITLPKSVPRDTKAVVRNISRAYDKIIGPTERSTPFLFRHRPGRLALTFLVCLVRVARPAAAVEDVLFVAGWIDDLGTSRNFLKGTFYVLAVGF